MNDQKKEDVKWSPVVQFHQEGWVKDGQTSRSFPLPAPWLIVNVNRAVCWVDKSKYKPYSYAQITRLVGVFTYSTFTDNAVNMDGNNYQGRSIRVKSIVTPATWWSPQTESMGGVYVDDVCCTEVWIRDVFE